MELAVDGWRNELKKYFRSVEHLTDKVLYLIKRDRIQNNLPFNDAFKTFFLDRTNSRIANAYTNFLYEDHFGDEVSHRMARTSTKHQLTLSTIISPESIEQMPVILVSPYNPMFDQMNIPMQSNQSASVPLDADIDRNSDQAYHAQSTESIVVVEEPRMDSEMRAEKFESDANNGNEELNTSVSDMTTEPTSTEANRAKHGEPSKKVMSSNTCQPETIDLTSDSEDAIDHLDDHLSDKVQPQTSIRRQTVCGASAAENSKNKCNNSTDSATLHINKLIQPAVPSSMHIGLNHQKISNKRPAYRATNEYQQRQGGVDSKPVGKLQKDLNSQHPKEIGLIPSRQDLGGNGVAKVNENVGDVNEKSIKKLKLVSTVNAEKRHTCNYCEYSTGYKCALTRHIRTHTNDRPHQCEVCNKQFSRKDALNCHMKTHRNLFEFRCSNCHRGFAHQAQWKSHESRCKLKQYECHLCGHKCHQNKGQLLVHMRFKHTGEKAFGCSNCPKRFCRKTDRTRHMKCLH